MGHISRLIVDDQMKKTMNTAPAAILFQQAYELHQAGRVSDALSLYNKALKSEPTNAQLLFLMGLAQQQMGQHDRALNFFSRALKSDPNNPSIYLHQGMSLGQKNQMPQAVKAYEEAIALQPDFFEAYCNLGNALNSTGKPQAALLAYEKALAIDAHSPVLHYNLGVIKQEQMRPQEAAQHFQKAVGLRPDYAVACANLSVALCEVGHIEEAIKANERALQLDPGLAEAHFNAHTYWLEDGKYDQAITCLEKAVKIAPKEDRYRFFLGMLLAYSGQTQQAQPLLAFRSPSRMIASDLEAWAYIQSLDPKPKLLGHAASVFRMAMGQAREDGLVMEFGVYHGTSIRQIAALARSDVHGFDSFEGIPEAWNNERAGSYSTQGAMPDVPQNVQLHAGWFEVSIPVFRQSDAAHSTSPVRLMNIDCDLYSSTKTVLDQFHSQICPGTVLVFDEFIGNLSWKQDEFKAFHDAARQYGWHFEVICFSFVTKQVALRIAN